MLRIKNQLKPKDLMVGGKYWFTHNGRRLYVRYRGEVANIHGKRYRFVVTGNHWRGAEWEIPFRSVQEKVTVRS